MLIVWIILVFGITEISSEKLENKIDEIPNYELLNLKKLSVLMEMEKETQDRVFQTIKEKKGKKEIKEIQKDAASKFFDEGFSKNEQDEKRYNKLVKEKIDQYEKESTFNPITFYKYITGEISGLGYSGYFDYLEQISKLRKRFFKYYFNKRYEVEAKKIESFIKNNENIFYAQSKLPGNFYSGLLYTALYTLVLFLASFLALKIRHRKKPAAEIPWFKPEFEGGPGRFYFILCEKEQYKNHIYSYYENRENTACIDNVQGREIDPGVGYNSIIKYFCKLRGAAEQDVRKNLGVLGIENMKETPETKRAETVKKIYCAAAFAVKSETIVIREFMQQESRGFEKGFLNLIIEATKEGKTVIYLSEEIFYTPMSMEGGFEYEKFKDFLLKDPLTVTLR